MLLWLYFLKNVFYWERRNVEEATYFETWEPSPAFASCYCFWMLVRIAVVIILNTFELGSTFKCALPDVIVWWCVQ